MREKLYRLHHYRYLIQFGIYNLFILPILIPMTINHPEGPMPFQISMLIILGLIGAPISRMITREIFK